MQKPSGEFLQSFARGLSVIRVFGPQSPVMTLSAVAEKTGLTRAGARRILLTLQSLGYVTSEGRDFRLTPRILDLGYSYLSSMPLWEIAQPIMEDLVAEVQVDRGGSDLVHRHRLDAQAPGGEFGEDHRPGEDHAIGQLFARETKRESRVSTTTNSPDSR